MLRECSSDLLPRTHLNTEQLRILRLTSGCKKTIKYVCRTHLKQYLYEFSGHQKQCCDPFKEHASKLASTKKHKATRSLHEINLQLRDRAKTINLFLIPGQKLCVTCKLKLLHKQISDHHRAKAGVEQTDPIIETQPPAEVAVVSSPSVHSSQQTAKTSPSVSDGGDDQLARNLSVTREKELSFDASAVDLEGLNVWLKNLGITPVSQRKIAKQENYGEKVLKKLKAALEKCSNLRFKDSQEKKYFSEMIGQLKHYIETNSANSKKVLALTVLPLSMSYPQMEETFGVSNYMARKSRSIVQQCGILAEPGAKLGRSISAETVNKVLSFYLSDDVSRPLPGRKDVVSVKENGIRVTKQKRLVLGTLGSLYSQFLRENQTNELSRGKFCELRPKECVLAGQAGTHVICVCTYHENPNLMFEHAHLRTQSLKGVKDCRELMLCSEPKRDCFLRQCENCPQTKLQETLEVHFDSEMIDSVTYNLWESTDTGNIVTLTETTENFITNFISQEKRVEYFT